MLSDDGDAAKIDDGKEISDWLPIQHDLDGEAFIDLDGYSDEDNIPLNKIIKV